ncbi:hypothetical protein BGZ83_001619 [Gryganskiella cystojenkinii]|nr:hypothetical protein BGZ83_001619 [Gryganskiella cystojenkinii]
MVMCPLLSRHLPSKIANVASHSSLGAARISTRTFRQLNIQASRRSIPTTQTPALGANHVIRSSTVFLLKHGWLTPSTSSSSDPKDSRQRRRSFSTKAKAEPVVFNNPMLNKMRQKLESMKELHDKVLQEINGGGDEELDASKFAEKTKQLHDLSLITDKYTELESQIRDLVSLRQMLEDPSTKQDKDLLDMTEEEIKETTERILEMEKELLLAMLPTDSADEANAILEIRAGTGGDEAGLFAADILRMYERFAEKQRWKWEQISMTHDGLGSIKDAMIAITGHNVFGQLKFESGVHRVQRVPATETQGRIHTSTITVAIMPQPTEVQVQIHDSDVRVDVFRASGSGGQKVNTTDSAIRLTHLATGIVVAIQDERSNQKNRAKAFTILRAKLFEREREKLAAERKDMRRKQNRVTDHRINKTLHELESVLEGDALPEFIDALRVEEQTDMLMAMNDDES